MRLDGYVGITVSNWNGGVKVIRVEKGDQAHVAGIRKGDVIYRINGIRCGTHSATIEKIHTASQLNMKELHFSMKKRTRCALLW